MTGPIAGYAAAIVALLFAAAAAFTIIYNVKRILDSPEEQPSREETHRKVAA